jgi:hypothetical protein
MRTRVVSIGWDSTYNGNRLERRAFELHVEDIARFNGFTRHYWCNGFDEAVWGVCGNGWEIKELIGLSVNMQGTRSEREHTFALTVSGEAAISISVAIDRDIIAYRQVGRRRAGCSLR